MSPRAGFLALSWPLQAMEAGRRAEGIGQALLASGNWRPAHAAGGLRLWITRRDPPPICRLARDRGVVVGPHYAMRGVVASRDPVTPHPLTVARDLSRSRWGRYLAILSDPAGEETWAYRDPSGAQTAFAWSLGEGLSVVSSQMSGLPPGVGPRRPLLDWRAISALVAKPAICATEVLVEDVVSVQPGECVRLGERPVREVVWSPAAFAADPIDDRELAAATLRGSVEDCTAALVGAYPRTILEVSGGLDSAILAGTVHQAGLTPRVAEALNMTFGRPESDEQDYARAVAGRAGLALTERHHDPCGLDLDDLEELACEFRPSANGVDPKWDREEIALVRATGAGAIVSGQGGDAVFMQMSTPGILADAWPRRSWRALGDPLLGDVARRTRRSVWGVLRDAREEAQGRARPSEDLWSSLISRGVRAATDGLKPRWEREAEARGLPPGKRLHIHALARFLLNEGPSRRRREVDILYPLFAQPVLEHALRIPTPLLAGASYDRAFAREAFADRLPEMVYRRRAKGVVTVYFARLIANSLGALRPYLLEGCLAEAGVLDRDRLEQALTRDHLIWAAKPSDILWAVATEAWVRHWQKYVPDSLTASRGN